MLFFFGRVSFFFRGFGVVWIVFVGRVGFAEVVSFWVSIGVVVLVEMSYV